MACDVRISIVRATEADLPAIATLARLVWRAHYPGIIPAEQIEYMLSRMYDLPVMTRELSEGIAYDVLFADAVLRAFASYGPFDTREMKLHKLYVHPESQRRGFGSRLLAHVEAIAASRGFRTICLAVNKANEAAIAAYRKNGFVVRDAVVVEIGGGFVMDDFVMAKTL